MVPGSTPVTVGHNEAAPKVCIGMCVLLEHITVGHSTG
jgi:hypothetical protein